MADWHNAAKRGLTLLDSDTSDEGTRTKRILNHVLDESHADGFISKDFYNVQQTAGRLPDTMTMAQFLAAITGHVRESLGSSSFNDDIDDNNFRTALMSFDSNIRHHITFLKDVNHFTSRDFVVHQNIAAGDVHKALWNLILDSLKDSNSIYSCYTDYLQDDR